ncbi:WhiB family transcriptional regulator [Jiangella asiatica]|uniref:WhiB family transcriptional regulator n=1 Tax=Jiangella asiatica TaxID=2530372 RepID=A0A4R5CIB6_9ACTN|nr:WhiB family transcriptional regulator [Jiangella asiatica]
MPATHNAATQSAFARLSRHRCCMPLSSARRTGGPSHARRSCATTATGACELPSGVGGRAPIDVNGGSATPLGHLSASDPSTELSPAHPGSRVPAKAISSPVPVRTRCLEEALWRDEPQGVWDGMTSSERPHAALLGTMGAAEHLHADLDAVSDDLAAAVGAGRRAAVDGAHSKLSRTNSWPSAVRRVKASRYSLPQTSQRFIWCSCRLVACVAGLRTHTPYGQV